jgi:hypothetical protein
MTEIDKSTGDPVEKAIGDLQRAEGQLREARSAEAAAEHEVAEATEELEAAELDFVTVHVKHVGELEHASFKEKRTATLQEVWDKSYSELKIPKQPKDVFQTGGEKPKSLMNYLGLTLEQAIQQKVIEDYHFAIATETGGAADASG